MDEDQVLAPTEEVVSLALYSIVNYYVNGTTGSDTNNGLSPETAFATVDKALNSISGYDKYYKIYVAAGEYTLSFTKSISSSLSVSIYGEAYTGDTPTVIFNGTYTAYSIHEIKNIKFNTTLKVSGFSNYYPENVFENCIFSKSGASCVQYTTSGTNERKTFTNCTFIDGTTSSSYYAVLYAQNSTFDNCKFQSSIPTNNAISLYTVVNTCKLPSVTFKNMYIPAGALYVNSNQGFSNLVFETCTFQNATSVTSATASQLIYVPTKVSIVNSDFSYKDELFKSVSKLYNNSLTAGLSYALQVNNYFRVNDDYYIPTNGTQYSKVTIDQEDYIRILCDRNIYNYNLVGNANKSYSMMRFYVDNLNQKKISFKVANVNNFSDSYKLSFTVLSAEEFVCNARFKEQMYISQTQVDTTGVVEFNFNPDKIGDYYIVFNSDESLPISGEYIYGIDVGKITVEEV